LKSDKFDNTRGKKTRGYQKKLETKVEKAFPEKKKKGVREKKPWKD